MKYTNDEEKMVFAVLLFIAFGILFTSCADVSDVDKCLPDDPYGFWAGVWHGWIAPIAFIGSLFNDDIAVYAINNNGGWYTFGFLLGIGAFSSSVTYSKKR